MPSSAARTFTDPDEYFAGIRNLQIEGVVARGEFRAELTRIDLHRLFMCRFDENLSRVMKVTPSGKRAGIVFATDPGGPGMLTNGIEISNREIARVGLDWEWYLRSSAPCEWGTMSLAPEDLAAAGETIIGRELLPPNFARSVAPPPTALSPGCVKTAPHDMIVTRFSGGGRDEALRRGDGSRIVALRSAMPACTSVPHRN